jgi:ATP/maltotriose-dependent transcriptional regulator MalT
MLAQMGQPLEALALAERSPRARQAVAGARPEPMAEAAFARSIAMLLSGRLLAAEASASELYESAVESGDVERIGPAAWWRGSASLCSGHVDVARRFLREAIEVMREVDTRGMLPWGFANLAQAAGQAGDAEEASAAVAAAQAAAPAGSWIYTASIELGRAWASAAEGGLSQARRSALDAGEIRLERGQLGAAFLDFHDLARLGGSEAAAPRLAELAGEVEGDWVRACSDHAAALAARDPTALWDAARAFEEVGAVLFAAEALSEAAGAFRSGGRMASARACAARGRALLTRCAGARTPALRAMDDFDELTPREREIATLAAGGLSNKAIAARLVLSVRTIENQLQRTYHKLGVTSRLEVAALLELDSIDSSPIKME